jgi:hypothetical protein
MDNALIWFKYDFIYRQIHIYLWTMHNWQQNCCRSGFHLWKKWHLVTNFICKYKIIFPKFEAPLSLRPYAKGHVALAHDQPLKHKHKQRMHAICWQSSTNFVFDSKATTIPLYYQRKIKVYIIHWTFDIYFWHSTSNHWNKEPLTYTKLSCLCLNNDPIRA